MDHRHRLVVESQQVTPVGEPVDSVAHPVEQCLPVADDRKILVVSWSDLPALGIVTEPGLQRVMSQQTVNNLASSGPTGRPHEPDA